MHIFKGEVWESYTRKYPLLIGEIPHITLQILSFKTYVNDFTLKHIQNHQL